jgi:hypothetical protein
MCKIAGLFIALFLITVNLTAQTKKPAQKMSDADVEKLVAANKKLMEIAIPVDKKAAGIGPNKGEPTGTPFDLPPCIKIVDRPHLPVSADPKKLLGSSNTFFVDISLVNKCSSPQTVTFPPGLIVVSAAEGFQKGLLVERVVVTVPPVKNDSKDKEDTTTIYLGVTCLNEHLEVPTSEAEYQKDGKVVQYSMQKGLYRPGKVTDHPGLLQLLDLIANKPKLRLSKEDNPFTPFNPEEEEKAPVSKKMEMYDAIQEAIWKVTDGRGLTKGEVEKLKEQLKAFE